MWPAPMSPIVDMMVKPPDFHALAGRGQRGILSHSQYDAARAGSIRRRGPAEAGRHVRPVRLKPDATDVVSGFSRTGGLAEPRPRRPTNLVSASASNQSRDLSLPVAAFFNE